MIKDLHPGDFCIAAISTKRANNMVIPADQDNAVSLGDEILSTNLVDWGRKHVTRIESH
jgi:hypothetical protein